MVTIRQKDYCCTHCGREQYTDEKCFGCGNVVFFDTPHKKEKEIRELLHNTINVMTYSQCLKVAEFLNFGNEFDEKIN